MMRRFVVYRPNPPTNYVKDGYANPPDQIQVTGVIMPSGKCIIEWQTAVNSIAIFESFSAFSKIHGHPEYETKIVWLDTGNDLAKQYGYFCPKCGTNINNLPEKCPKCGQKFMEEKK